MNAEQVANFFAVMLIGGLVGTAVAIAVPALRTQVAEAALPLAAVVALAAMLGSLYFSEIAHYEPCELCWFQRYAMYPMAVVLPIAAARGARRILPLALVVSLIGLSLSIYHVQLQMFPEQTSFCDAVNPCSGRWVEALGFVTIPQMAGASFTLIATLATLAWATSRTPAMNPEDPQ